MQVKSGDFIYFVLFGLKLHLDCRVAEGFLLPATNTEIFANGVVPTRSVSAGKRL